jgi:FkbM family methyltransferase
MIIFNDNKGRLGNSLFRLFANIVFLTIYKQDAPIYNYINRNSLCVNDNDFIAWMNNVLSGTTPKLVNPNANYLFDGYYQHDAIFVKFKKEIVEYIIKHQNLIIRTDKNDSYRIIDFINYPIQKQYNIVVHLRLEDFITISQVIDPNCIQVVIDEIASLYSNEQICIVVNKSTTDVESKYIDFLKKRNSNITVESNDVITDFTIMKNAKVLVCSCSTLSWAASLLSTTLQKVYIPDYVQVNGSHQTFKNPIQNTSLYNIRTCTFDELTQILDNTDSPVNQISYSLKDSKGLHFDLKLDSLFGAKKNGVFIELGAFDGLTQSNTAFFEFYRNWTGILIEPSKQSYDLCCANRPKSICLNLCCVSSEYTEKTIFGDFNSITMASVNGERLNSQNLVEVNCNTLNNIVRDHIPNKTIDLLSLDTEGYELNILKGFDLSVNRPKFLLIEVYKSDYDKITSYLSSFKYAMHSNFSNYNKVDNPIWDGTHNDFLFYDENKFCQIITGEKIQQICDIYLGFDDDFRFNPVIASQNFKHCNLNSLTKPFDNPQKIFCFSHRIDKLSSVIHLFQNDFILVTHNSDGEIRKCEDVVNILNCDKLLKWFGQNICFDHEKLCFLPIGLANSQWPHGNLSAFHNTRFSSTSKTNDVYFNFNISTNIIKRKPCYDILKNKLQWLATINPTENHKRLSTFRFCICPDGNGMDTHRLWECLYLNVVPIVIKNEFTNLLVKQNIPLVVLDSWENFDLNSLKYSDFDFESNSLQELLDFSNYSSKISMC